MDFIMPACAKFRENFQALLLCTFLVISGCNGSATEKYFTLQRVDARWSNGQLIATIHQNLVLSSEARRALRHGVPLTVQMELMIKNRQNHSRVMKNLESYEIRYLPMSDHYQLTLPGGNEIRTFPRLRHLLADLSSVTVSFSTGVMPAGDYELLARTRMDKRKIPPPMRLPTLFSSEWRHDSSWSAWPLEINPQA